MREGGLLVLARPLTPAAPSHCLSAFGNLKGYYSANLREREGKKKRLFSRLININVTQACLEIRSGKMWNFSLNATSSPLCGVN